MGDTWNYREPDRPQRHASSEPAEHAGWAPQSYNQSEHLKRLKPRTVPDEAQGPRPTFAPASSARPVLPPGYPAGPPAYQPPQQYYRASQRGTAKKSVKVAWGIVGGLAAIIAISVIASSHSSSNQTPAATSSPTEVVTDSSAPAAPASSAPAQSAQPAAGTVSEQQALVAAQQYLSDGDGFSRQGLINQLDSPDGNGFSVADATWAADHSGANWNAQAVLAAKGYMAMGGFSRSSLIDQLDSPDGNGFTYAQAEQAASAVGL